MNNAQTRAAGLMLSLLWLPWVAIGDENQDEKTKHLSSLDIPPVFIRNDKNDSKWPRMIREGVEESRTYFGNYDPVYAYILGLENSELNSDVFHRHIVDEYCKHRHSSSSDRMDKCKSRDGPELVRKALSGRGDALVFD